MHNLHASLLSAQCDFSKVTPDLISSGSNKDKRSEEITADFIVVTVREGDTIKVQKGS